MKYQNIATSNNPALIIFLVDVSGSMEHIMPSGKRRIEVVREVLHESIQEMHQRSIIDANNEIRPKYRIGLFAYSEDIWDIGGGIKLITEIGNEGIPDFPLQTYTDMAKAFRGVTQIIEEDIKTWSNKWKEKCPAPMVIHITDAEITEKFEDPTSDAKKLMSLSVPDGNVLLTNIFTSEFIKLPDVEISQWAGFFPEDTTEDRFGDMLLAMSSRIPEPYINTINTKCKIDMNLKSGARMLFPGVSEEFIALGFAMSGVSSYVTARPIHPEYSKKR